MKKSILYLLLPLFLAFMPVVPLRADVTTADGRVLTEAQMDSLRQTDDFVRASLVVTDPGEVLYSMLGHACLHLECPVFDMDYIFSYESESVENKVLRFLMGDLKMGMFPIETEEFIQLYRAEGRGVREYPLCLSPEQKTRLWQVLDDHVDEGVDLQYDYFHKGCAKSVVMVLSEVLRDQQITYAPWADKYTLYTQRELVQDAITSAVKRGLLSERSARWNAFFMYALIGSDGDKDYPCEKKLIVPNDLVEVWQQATVNGNLLLSKEANVLYEAPPKNFSRCWLTPTMLAVVLLLLALVGWWTEWKCLSWLVLLAVSAVGTLMTYLLLFSALPCTTWNWLIIPFNLLPLIAWRWRRYWALPYAGIVSLWVVGMLCWPHRIVDPAYLVLALAEIVVFLQAKLIPLRQLVCSIRK